MDARTPKRSWTVGELAAATGLTVRTLHHYEEVGLLTPSERTEAGHRRYLPDDVERLYRIRALRRLGLSLQQIAGALTETIDLAAALRAHLMHVDGELEQLTALRARLNDLVQYAGAGVPTAELLATIEGMTTVEQHFTPEQLETLRDRRNELGDEGMRQGEDAWKRIGAALREHMAQETDPGSEELAPIAAEARGLIASFTQGDPEMLASLNKLRQSWHESKEQHPNMTRSGWDPELSQYMQRVMSAHGGV